MKRRDAIKNVVLTSALGTVKQMLPKDLFALETQKQNHSISEKNRVPRAITMWDFSWLELQWPGAVYEDWDKALGELKERNTEIAFRNFQAGGAFLITAAKNGREVYFLQVEARKDNICQIMNPWFGRTVTVIESGSNKPVKTSIDKSNGESIVFRAKAGQKYKISVQQ